MVLTVIVGTICGTVITTVIRNTVIRLTVYEWSGENFLFITKEDKNAEACCVGQWRWWALNLGCTSKSVVFPIVGGVEWAGESVGQVGDNE